MRHFRPVGPPHDAVMPDLTQDVLIVVTALAVLAILAFALRETRRGDPVLLYVLLGSLLVIVYEPLGDALLGAYYPEAGQTTALRAFGRDMPLFLLLLYPPYFVPFVVIFFRIAAAGFTRRSWWALWGGTLASGAIMEMVVQQFGNPWLYYGSQTLVVFDLPLWVTATNVTFLFATGAAVHTIATRLDSRHHWLALPTVPVMTVAGHAAVALPGAAVRQGTDNDVLVLAGGLGSIAIAVLIAYALSFAFCPSRYRQTA